MYDPILAGYFFFLIFFRDYLCCINCIFIFYVSWCFDILEALLALLGLPNFERQ